MAEERKVTTKGSQKSLEVARSTYKFIIEDYINGHAHKNEGKPVVWSCALADKELYWAMGLHPFFPEQFAALAAVRRKTKDGDKEAIRFAQIAEQAGYSSDLCGYERVATGYVITGDLKDAPLDGMPKPDMLCTTSSACDVRLKWFEDMSQRLGVPLFTFDRPERLLNGVLMQHGKPHEVKYYKSQLEDFMQFCADITGIKYSEDRLNECLDWSYKTNELRLEILQLRKAVPSPMGCADGFATMYPGMYDSGTERAYNYYKALRDEVKAKVDAGVGQIENERFRLLWFGIPLWFNMSIFNYFEPIGGVFAYEPAYNPAPWPVRTDGDPLEYIAQRNTSAGTAMSNLDGLLEQCREYNISGGVLAFLITCRAVYIPAYEVRRILEKELGIPCVLIECDLVDERYYSEAQVKTRMDAFAEQLLKKLEIGK